MALTLGLLGGEATAFDLTRGGGGGVGKEVVRGRYVGVEVEVDWEEGVVVEEGERKRSVASLLVGRGSTGSPKGSVVSGAGVEVSTASSDSTDEGTFSAVSCGAGSSRAEGSAPAVIKTRKVSFARPPVLFSDLTHQEERKKEKNR